MKFSTNQKGSSHLVVLLLVVLVAVVGFAGYRVMKNQDASVASTANESTVAASTVPAKIKTKPQAQQASKALDAEAIDKTLDSTQLDSDLNSVL